MVKGILGFGLPEKIVYLKVYLKCTHKKLIKSLQIVNTPEQLKVNSQN